MPKCIVCQKDIPEDEIQEIPDKGMCCKCWLDFRYGAYEDGDYNDFQKLENEYNYIGMYPNYKRKID